jgi:hypothetical protein
MLWCKEKILANRGKRTLTRRDIVIDKNETELTSEHMKAMRRDTSDIVLEDEPGLADWPREDAEEVDPEYARLSRVLNTLPMERLLARPCLGDDGGLAPELLAIWGRNTIKISGKPGTQLPFRMRGAKGEEERDDDEFAFLQRDLSYKID